MADKRKAAQRLAERRTEAFRLFREGNTYREIAIAISKKKDSKTRQPLWPKYEHSMAFRDVKAVLAEFQAQRFEQVEQYLEVELQRLDVAAKAIAARVQNGELFALDRWIKIIEVRARLLGLEAPIRLQVEQTVDKELQEFLSSLERMLPAETFKQVIDAVSVAGDRAAAANRN